VLTLLAALTLAVAPPPGHLALGRTSAPLAISSYCWHGQCAAPLGASTLIAVVPRRYPIRCDLGYTPTRATLTIGGRSATVTPTIDGVTWNANWAGGVTLRVESGSGWVVYVGRIALRRP
jgi:hypothetical protein